jgi:hypothetical protein
MPPELFTISDGPQIEGVLVRMDVFSGRIRGGEFLA